MNMSDFSDGKVHLRNGGRVCCTTDYITWLDLQDCEKFNLGSLAKIHNCLNIYKFPHEIFIF